MSMLRRGALPHSWLPLAALCFAGCAAPSFAQAPDADRAVDPPAAASASAKAPTTAIAAPKEKEGEASTEIIQAAAPQESEVAYGQSIATRYRVGAKIEAKGGSVQNIFIMVAVPLECPEQEVHIIEEDFSPNLQGVEFRTLPDMKNAEPGARQMLISIPELAARQDAHALITYEVVTKATLPPAETATLVIPAKPDRALKTYLSGSPYINVNERHIRDAVRDALAERGKKDDAAKVEGGTGENDGEAASPGEEVADDADVSEDAYETVEADKPQGEQRAKAADEKKPVASSEPVAADKVAETVDSAASASSASASEPPPTDWQRVEALYDYVRNHVKYLEGAEDMSSVQALKAEEADCHGMSALFVAMCRTMKTPARMVWVDGHQYAEFYLEDAAGKGHWYPAQLAGTRAFGEMPTPLAIFQKGDNFRVPERRRERLRYATDHTTLLSSPKHKPRVTYVREAL